MDFMVCKLSILARLYHPRPTWSSSPDLRGRRRRRSREKGPGNCGSPGKTSGPRSPGAFGDVLPSWRWRKTRQGLPRLSFQFRDSTCQQLRSTLLSRITVSTGYQN